MKKRRMLVLILVVVLVVIAFVSLGANKKDTSSKKTVDTSHNVPNLKPDSVGLEFALYLEGESYSVVGIGTCTDTDVVIPSMYQGLPVTNIGTDAFSGCTSLTSVTIPNSVTRIGYGAFTSCTSLTSITISNSVTSIGYGAFRYCASLKSITIPDGVKTISGSVFYGCDKLTSIKISTSVERIDEDAFRGCSSLSRIDYDGNVKQWGNIPKGPGVLFDTGSYTIYCFDGQIAKDGTVTYK